MLHVFDRRLTTPSCGIALFTVALMAQTPALILTLLLAVALTVMARGARGGATDAADLVRLDDDGGRQPSLPL